MITQIMISSYLSKASITYHDVAFNTANLTTYTFSNQPIGDAEPDRYVFFVAAIHRNAATTATATINGVSAVLVHSGFNTTSLLCIFRSASPIATGTTADISITANGACNSCGIAVYTGVGIKNITPQNTYSSIANPPSFTVTVPSDGFLLAAAFTINGTASFTWTGAAEMQDTQCEGQTYSSAIINEGISTTVTATPTTATLQTGIAVTFR